MKLRKLSRAVSSKNPSSMGLVERKYYSFLKRKYKEMLKKIKQIINATGGKRLTPGDIAEILSKTSFVVRETLLNPAQRMIDEYTDLAVQAAHHRSVQFLNRVGVQAVLGILPVDQSVISVLKLRGIASITGIADETEKKIRQVISDAVIRGKSMNDIAGELTEQIGITFNRAKTIARTEVMYAFNTVAQEEYKHYDVKKVEWLTASDERTCPICKPLNGKIFDIDKAPDIPAHPNCRCVLLPVIEEEG